MKMEWNSMWPIMTGFFSLTVFSKAHMCGRVYWCGAFFFLEVE